jgi:hypothetical protein
VAVDAALPIKLTAVVAQRKRLMAAGARRARVMLVAYPDAVSHLGLVTVVVSEYDPAIRFFVDALGSSLSRTVLR